MIYIKISKQIQIPYFDLELQLFIESEDLDFTYNYYRYVCKIYDREDLVMTEIGILNQKDSIIKDLLDFNHISRTENYLEISESDFNEIYNKELSHIKYNDSNEHFKFKKFEGGCYKSIFMKMRKDFDNDLYRNKGLQICNGEDYINITYPEYDCIVLKLNLHSVLYPIIMRGSYDGNDISDPIDIGRTEYQKLYEEMITKF